MNPTLFDGPAAGAIAAAAAFAGLLGWIVAERRGEVGAAARLAGLEAALVCILGALAARTVVFLALRSASFSPAAVYVVGWALLFWPGIVDTVVWLVAGHTICSAGGLVYLATLVGAAAGLADGVGRIHDWRNRGVWHFLADVTWGLANTCNGCLIHLANSFWGKPLPSVRVGAHRYDLGFCFAPRFALTQGNVCSNLRGRAETDLFDHEYVHVMQNRYFGPFFPLTYIGWMIVLFAPAALYGLIVGRLGSTILSWCYCNNPWEEWAYRVGGGRDPALVWPIRRTLIGAAIFYPIAFGFAGWAIYWAWIS